MDVGLLLIGMALLLMSYLVAVKKQTWLLAGFNEKLIRNKSLLGTVTGAAFFFPIGTLVIINSFIDYPYESPLLTVVILTLLIIVYMYINRKLLDKW